MRLSGGNRNCCKRLVLSCLGGLLGAAAPRFAQAGPWTSRVVDRDPFSIHRTPSAADLDGDGDLDLLTGFWWYENLLGDASTWVEHGLGLRLGGPTLPADVDGDGDLDVGTSLSDYAIPGDTSSLVHTVGWLENVAGNASSFVPRPVGLPVDIPIGIGVGDMDGDGDPDLLTLPATDTLPFAWHENIGASTPWTEHAIGPSAFGASIAVADVDGDGDLDIFRGGAESGYAWYENAAGDGTLWTEHFIVRVLANAFGRIVRAVDFDGDGDVDAVFATQGFYLLRSPDVTGWLENTRGDGSSWAARRVRFEHDVFSSDVLAKDLDRDGDLDIVRSFDRGLVWYEDLGGDGRTWPERSIGAPGSEQDIADLDADGDLDAMSDYRFDSLAWHENLTPTTPYGSDVNPAGSLGLASGPLALGAPAVFELTNPLGTQAAGSFTRLLVADRPKPNFPAGTLRAGFGMRGPGALGEFLIDRTPPNPLALVQGPPWLGPGTRAQIVLPVPDDPALLGVDFFFQGLIIDESRFSGVRFGLTNGLRATVGP